MSSELKIRNMNEQTAPQPHPLKFDFLPNPRNMRMLIIAPSGGGKSQLVLNLLSNPSFGMREFFGESIVIVSTTIGKDPTYQNLIGTLPKTHVMTEWNDRTITQLMKYSSKQPNGILLIVDDMLGSNTAMKRSSGKTTMLERIFIEGRHFKVQIFALSQRYYGFSPIIRANNTHTCVFSLRNTNETKLFLHDHDHIEGIEDLYRKATAEPYSFAYIDKIKRRVFRCFEEELTVGERSSAGADNDTDADAGRNTRQLRFEIRESKLGEA